MCPGDNYEPLKTSYFDWKFHYCILEQNIEKDLLKNYIISSHRNWCLNLLIYSLDILDYFQFNSKA